MGGSDLVYELIATPGGAFTTSEEAAFVVLMVGIGLLATARPLLVLVVLFGGPTWSLVTADGGLSTALALGASGMLVLGEHHLRSTDWTELFEGAFELQGVLGIGVAWVWFVIGASPRGVVFDLGSPATALSLVMPLVLAVVLHALVYRARARVWRLVRDVGLSFVATAIETAAVGSIAALLLFAPYLAVGLAVAGVVPLALTAILVRALTKRVDARFRQPCPSCGRPARVEASRCPHCRADIPVVASLG